MKKIKVSKQIVFLNFIHKEVKHDYSLKALLKTFSLFDSVLMLLSLTLVLMSIYMSQAGLMYYFSPLLIGLAIYGLLLFASKDRLGNVKLSNFEKEKFTGIIYGLSYSLINQTCDKRIELGITDSQLDETIRFVEKNPFKEPFLFLIPVYMKSVYGLFITTAALFIGVFKVTQDLSKSELAKDSEVSQVVSEPSYLLLIFFLILFAFAITSYFFKSIQPLSVNERVIRVLSLMKLSVCKR